MKKEKAYILPEDPKELLKIVKNAIKQIPRKEQGGKFVVLSKKMFKELLKLPKGFGI